MPLDLTVDFQSILTIGSFLVGGTIFVAAVRSNMSMLAQKVDDKFIVVDASIEDFKVEMKKLGEVLVELTRQEGRQNLADERVLAQGRRIDEIGSTLRQLMVQQMQRDSQSPAE